ncbi:alpha/beta hydrolase fold domain-containing protein [Streptomyces sp. WI04-05B]|nr:MULTISPECIES: alpha/beta hydrolase fold domain-containing protein [unclassified Streptomyces]MDX2546874.1 alpha/beta hydrolase fold domain-containing protein [Streptomyces sp. WI04-05B]MDX2589671.1 alpha/beta hydrolase fold domain-containing protein [Streptomyces sp. WI04-05A]
MRAQHPAILAGVLYSGVFDLWLERFSTGTWTERAATDFLLSEGRGCLMHDGYLAGHPADDPLVSPVLADLGHLPSLFLQVFSAERLLDDSLILANRAARAGAHVELEVWPRMFHAWQVAAGFLPEASAAFIRRAAEGKIVDGVALAGGSESVDEVISG